MTSKSLRLVTVIPAVMSVSLALVGCGGGSAPAPNPTASAGGDSKPKAPPVKGKGGRLIESEENTPERFKNRDN